MKKILFIFGTRPEAIKLAPLIKKMEKEAKFFQVKVCVTAQHREMLDQVLNFFNIKTDFDLNLMKDNQFLSGLTADALEKIDRVLEEAKPDLVIVQGDTASAFIGALAAFYRKIKIGYVEDGLRSGSKFSPFPEEVNRRMISQLADIHFTPTIQASKNLRNENIRKQIFMVGNTVVDALFLGLDTIQKSSVEKEYKIFFKNVDFSKKIILVTCHRRESFGEPLQNICLALKEIAKTDSVQVIFPVHPNPNIKKMVYGTLGNAKNIHLVEPLDYSHLLWLMKKSFFIITDSGGIQEEAPSLKKPILVVREVTERPEGVKAGVALLVGNSQNKIVKEALALIFNHKKYKSMCAKKNPYGDGKTSERIIKILKLI